MDMPYLFNGDKNKATDLYDHILSNFEQARDSDIGVHAIGYVIDLVTAPEIVPRWLISIRDGGWSMGKQAFGELLMLFLCEKPGDDWALKEIDTVLKNRDLVTIHRGVAFTAAKQWHSKKCQDHCTLALVALTGSDDKIVQDAVSRVFRYGEDVPFNKNMKKLIEAMLPHDGILLKSARNLIPGIEYATAIEPELVNHICSRAIDSGMEEIKNVGSGFSVLAEPLVSIALTLHRLPHPHREAGLTLFEKLVESNIQEARQALDILDRRPSGRHVFTLVARRRRPLRT